MIFQSKSVEPGITERTKKLKSNMTVLAWTGGMMQDKTKISLERARFMTESYRKTEGEPTIIRRAKSLKNVLEKMTIYIREGELIVGNMSENPQAIPIYPEFSTSFIVEGLKEGFKGMLDEEEIKEIKEIDKYWEGKCMEDLALQHLPESFKMYIQGPGGAETIGVSSRSQTTFASHYDGKDTLSPNHEKLLYTGLNGVIEDAKRKLEEIDVGKSVEALRGVGIEELVKKRAFYEAIIIANKAVISFAERYSELAKELAQKEPDVKRKDELLKISEICRWVPANPPRTLHEALQFYWFCHLINFTIEHCGHGNVCRLDQIMYPFYKKDIEKGRITRDEAQELLECLWIKFLEPNRLQIATYAASMSGGTMFQLMTLGGQTRDGEDATNDFTYLMLDVTKSIRTIQPSLCLRMHRKTPDKLLHKVLEVIKTGMGMPAIYNDDTIIQYLLEHGAPLKDARNYALLICVRPSVPGKNLNTFRVRAAVSWGKILELALNDGRDPVTEEQFGPKTGDPLTFTSYNDLWKAYEKQGEYVFKLASYYIDVVRWLRSQIVPRPFGSSLVDGAIELGRDVSEWDEGYSAEGFTGNGAVVAADSLAAVKKLVFEEKAITMETLLGALKKNFEGHEELRQMLLNKAPKFGNDDDYVDLIARDIYNLAEDNARLYKTQQYNRLTGRVGVMHTHGIAPIGGFVPMGAKMAATPNGRRAGEPIDDGGVSPCTGMDRKGPTAVLKSAGKAPHTRSYLLLNQRLNIADLQGAEGQKRFVDYIKTWYQLGLWHIQLNVVDTETLRDAQKHPEMYSNLVVRVAGYSAYWTQLDRNMQEAIIARNEQHLS